ncbi:MAG TPA: alpha-L-fucosidase [Chitinophaga sp.]|uniref:alpha-L-fucosidase n=1 Tax=Chitinophaga sp. TaxID=1869181 RepID=UPI002B9FEF3A|nr:alpha-L-fucosidase [Chitinophaga sp.]HVI49029.1 alpha-L-fucosidase [Chitinophaga sp.]
MYIRNIFCIFLCLIASLQLKAQQSTPASVLNDFMAQRFGMFIHWGPVTLRGTEIGWSRGSGVPTAEYDQLYKEFNPVLFDADNWAKTARKAGMKYLTITAKHHDGFCLWPTAFSDYNIMHTPFKRDIVGELAAACKREGILFCIYFTVLDWHDPDYTGDAKTFVQRMKNELKELITNYHPYMLWFDGNWEQPWKQEYGAEIYSYIKSLDKDVIINNRLGKGKHTELGAGTVGDYATPEQFIGALNMNIPWESCITICQQWSWKPNDAMKSLRTCIQTLVKTAASNGNLLFNIGPMPDGRIEQRQVSRLEEMGSWLNKYGESIYGTKGGPFTPDSIFATTRKGNTLYLHVFDHQKDTLTLPPLGKLKVRKAAFIKGEAVVFTSGAAGTTIRLPAALPDSICSVIALELNGNAEALPVIKK